ncbi:MAG: undecaprenyl-diphosphate phosphatase [bacterium]
MLILAVAQGLTEFLPVSSSGHLVLLQHWFGSLEGDIFLVIVLHCGTLGSVVWVYRREIMRLLACDRPAWSYLIALGIGTVPAVIFSLLFKSAVEGLFNSPLSTGLALVVTACLLFSTRFVRGSDQSLPEPWQPHPPPLLKALFIGIAQALAITPGISRSGATIAASLWSGLPRAEAARFSFLLSVPAVGGALALKLFEGEYATSSGLLQLVLAAVAAFGVGLLAIRWTAQAVVARHFWKFCFYCLILGAVVIFVVGNG